MEKAGNGGAMSVGVPVAVGSPVSMEANVSSEIQTGQVLVPEGEVRDASGPNDISSDDSKQEADVLMDYAKSKGADETLERFASGKDLDMDTEAVKESPDEADSDPSVKKEGESIVKDSEEVLSETDDASQDRSEKVDVAAVQAKVEEFSARLDEQAQENSELRARLDAYASISLEELLRMLLEEKNKEKEKEQEKPGLIKVLLMMLIEFIIGTLKEGGKTAVSEMKPRHA